MADTEINSTKLSSTEVSSGNNRKKPRIRISIPPAMRRKNGFALADFVAPAVAQFLGVRSLVRFGAVCKSHKVAVTKEVTRRKECIADIEDKVKQLMGSQPESVPTSENVIAARKLSDNAKRMIDDEINFHKKLCTRELDLDGYGPGREFDFFLNERKKFLAASGDTLGSLVILPDCFYFPPDGESSNPSQEEIQNASKKASRLWGAESLMSIERYMWDDNWDKLNYEQPFRKFSLPGAGHFTYECMEETAMDLAHQGTIDAFRIAARKVTFRAPDVSDFKVYACLY